MLSLPIWGLFERVGSVELTPSALYWEYRASLSALRGGFPRLYFHGSGSNLGAFDRCGRLSGRISRRMLGAMPESGVFSILQQPWQRMTPTGFDAPVTALRLADGFCVAFPLRGALPEAALARFCFLTRCEAGGETCWQLLLDKNGAPVPLNP